MKFLVPSAEDEAHGNRLYGQIRRFVEDAMGAVDDRKVYRVSFYEKTVWVSAEVGKQFLQNGELVFAIFSQSARNLFFICTENRGVTRGTPILVNIHGTESEDFNDIDDNAEVREAIDPISTKFGGIYIAIKCSNRQCGEKLPLLETPSNMNHEDQNMSEQHLETLAVKCPFCKRKTILERRRFFTLFIR